MFLKNLIIFVFIFIPNTLCDIYDNTVDGCNLPKNIINEIKSYQPLVDKIIKSVVFGNNKGSTYKTLADFIDTFGNRPSGSENLENAIDYMLNKSRDAGLENIHGEEVTVPHWIRGNESAVMLRPRFQNLPMLSLFPSVATPPKGIKAEVVVVSSFKELEKVGSKAKNKIVVFNEKYVDYGTTVAYRRDAADKASKHGAVAVLIRSITPFSIETPHTGMQRYGGTVPPIPAACITIEDAHMLHRRYKRGDNIVIKIKMEAKNLPPKKSRNTVVDIKGREAVDEVVIVSGHLDSWDVGEGAMDDGAGALLAWNSLVILKNLRLRPRRTLRAILWTGEEEGLVGAFSYVKTHKSDLEKINFVMESDEGTFKPLGLSYAGSKNGSCIVQEILQLFGQINATKLKVDTEVGSDIIVFTEKGIPGAALMNANEKYFWYHHSAGDTMDVEDSGTLDECTALWAAVSYIVSDLSFKIPRK